MSSRLPVLLAAVLAAVVDACPVRADGVAATRMEIQQILAAHPGNAAIEEAGLRALQALDHWEATARAERRRARTPGSAELADRSAALGAAALPNPMTGLDSWNVNDNSISVNFARQDWTVGELFEGGVGSFDARYTFDRFVRDRELGECACNPPPPAPYQSFGTARASGQWAEEGLERWYVGVAGWTVQRNFGLPGSGWRALRDTLELGALAHGIDDPLGLESYTELSLVRAGRTWGWRPRGGPYLVMAGVGFSGGWAWAESIEPTYNDVSNPIVGSWMTLGVARPGWGKVYVEQRAVNGFQFSSPSAGGSTSREARFRFGFIKNLESCLSLELFIDKRSFNFSDHHLPDLYTKAKRTGVEVACSW